MLFLVMRLTHLSFPQNYVNYVYNCNGLALISYIFELINIKENGGYDLRSNKGLLLQAPGVNS